MFATEFEFTLPKGYVDAGGTLHRDGTMRLATAADEIQPLKDPRVVANPAYLAVILLSRVVTRLGGLSTVNPKVIEGLYVSDLAFLQDFYNRANGVGDPPGRREVACPGCGGRFEVEPEGVGRPGGIVGYPLDLLRREVAFFAANAHWSYETVMSLEHRDRREWLEQIARVVARPPSFP